MRIAKFQRTIISAVAVLTFACVLAGLYQTFQQTLNPASAKQELGPAQDGAKRKWGWRSPLPAFLEIVEMKNMDSETWPDDLAIKVRNKSDKPIVYIEFIVFVDELDRGGYKFNTLFHFGDIRMFFNPAVLDSDRRLQPGEEVVLTHGEEYGAKILKIYADALSQRGDLTPSDLRLSIAPYSTIFADGTQYNGSQWIRGTGPKQSSIVPRYQDNAHRASSALSSILNFLPVKKKTGSAV